MDKTDPNSIKIDIACKVRYNKGKQEVDSCS